MQRRVTLERLPPVPPRPSPTSITPPTHSTTSSMASRWADSPAPRRVVALKRADGEPLTRVDIQYDVLNTIFSDAHAVFSDPYAAEEGSKLTFCELYTKAILHSPKATKALKDKMLEVPAFAEDFAMLALLVNVGRLNTTMSCQSSTSFLCAPPADSCGVWE